MLIFLNQIRMKIGVMFGNPETTTGGNALKFYASIRMEIRRIGAIKDRDEIVGNQTRVKVVKNKLAPPFREVEFDIMYGEGISKVGELIDLGVKAGVVEKSGAWFSYDSQRIGQGRENAKIFLREHKDVAEAIERKLREKSGTVADAMLASEEEVEAAEQAPSSRGAMFDTLTPSGGISLDGDDLELLEAAEAVLRKHYRPFWHMVAAALRTRDGRVFTGIHLGATVGRLSVCAEAVALGRAVLEGDGSVAAVVAMRHPKPDEQDRTLAVVAPCGACREMLIDYAPDALVILPAPEGPLKLPARRLLPMPYRR